MTRDEAIRRIREHMVHHHMGEYPHIFIGEALEMAIAALREQEALKVNKPLTREELQKFIGRCVWWNGETCYCENGYLVTDDGTFSFDWVLSHGDVYCRNPESKDSGRCNFCKDQWISVKDQWPEYKKCLLFVDEAGRVWLSTDNVDWPDGGVRFLEPVSGLWVRGTHWMNLPDAPKEDIND